MTLSLTVGSTAQQRTPPIPTISAQPPARDAERELAIQERISTLTFWLVVVGGVVGLLQIGVIGAQAVIFALQLKTTRVVERAYVDISHDPPGLLMMGDDIRFSLGVKNHGRTPAQVSRPHMLLVLKETDHLPHVPPYGTPASVPTSAFLMPTEAFHQVEIRPPFPADVVQMIHAGQRHLWLIGYVDYVDRFGNRHRSGYARKFIHPPLPGSPNNLVFVTQPGYNYDVKINEHGHNV